MKKIILITGGQRSGKSQYAERLALSLTPNPVYVATAHIWDDEFRQRVLHHQARRGPEWTNIEEEKYLSRHDLTGRVAVIDCITLWCTNFLTVDSGQLTVDSSMRNIDQQGGSQLSTVNSQLSTVNSQLSTILDALKSEFDRFTQQDATFIFVTNEIGMGGTSDHPLQRHFTDLQGWMNQYVAQQADEVILMVSGLPLTLKSPSASSPSPSHNSPSTPLTPSTP